MKITLTNGDISTISEEELTAYKKYVIKKYPNDIIDEIILTFDDEEYTTIEPLRQFAKTWEDSAAKKARKKRRRLSR